MLYLSALSNSSWLRVGGDHKISAFSSSMSYNAWRVPCPLIPNVLLLGPGVQFGNGTLNGLLNNDLIKSSFEYIFNLSRV